MESQKFSRGGMNDIESADGGSDPNVYEIGSDMTLIPNNFWGQ
jgi:hypothetical protein